MAAKNRNTVVGVFRDEENARNAIRALKEAGFTEEQIGLIHSTGEQTGTAARAKGDFDGDRDEGETYAGEGAAAGLATGAGVGALWGLGILAGVLPAIGPAIAGGTLAVLLSSAAAGAAAAGIAGALIGLGMTKEEAEYYESEVRAGRAIVTVNAGTRWSEARNIMETYGGYDMESRDEAGIIEQAGAGTTPHTSTERAASQRRGEQTVQAREERLNIDKSAATTGEARVRKETHTEHEQIDVPVTKEEVVVEHRTPRAGAVGADDLQAGEEIRIPVREEQVRVEKETVAVDEVSIGKRQVQDTERVEADLQKESIEVDTKGNARIRNQRKQ